MKAEHVSRQELVERYTALIDAAEPDSTVRHKLVVEFARALRTAEENKRREELTARIHASTEQLNSEDPDSAA